MNQNILLVWMIVNLFFAAAIATAQPHRTDGAIGVRDAEEIVTAIDVAEQWIAGRTDADLAAALSEQKGYDRQAALKKGLTDEQIIKHLITKPVDASPQQRDIGRSGQHKLKGTKYLQESNYGSSAMEYTRAIKFSRDSEDLYILRADTYKQYLKTRLNPLIQSHSGTAKQGSLDKSRGLLCDALYADYETAARISLQKREDSFAELKAMQASMGKSRAEEALANDTVAPYYQRSARNIQIMRQMQRKYYDGVKKSKQPVFTVDQVRADCELVCGKKADTPR